jgi:hypothetical protein
MIKVCATLVVSSLHKAKHNFPTEARRLAYRWLDHWLRFTPVRDEVGG